MAELGISSPVVSLEGVCMSNLNGREGTCTKDCHQLSYPAALVNTKH